MNTERALKLFARLFNIPPDKVEIKAINNPDFDAIANAMDEVRSEAFDTAAALVLEGCAWAPKHENCDHADIAAAIEGYRDNGVEGVIAALDARRAARRSTS